MAGSAANTTSQGYPIIAGLVIEPAGQMLPLWVTMFAFGNLFAVFWLVRAFLNAHPHIGYQVSSVLANIGLGGLSRSQRRRRSAAAVSGRPSATSAAATDSKAVAKGASTGTPAATAVTAAAHAVSQGVSGIELMPSIGGASVGEPQRSRHHHHHAQPVICEPSVELSAGQDSYGVTTQPSLTPAGTSLGDAEGTSSHGSLSSYSSDDDSKKVPVQLQWINMCFSAKTAAGKKRIVQGIYGVARPHELQGLMGPSGAGKSTLMDLLAMRTDHDGAAAIMPGADDGADCKAANAVGATPSQLLVNGVEVSRKDFMSVSAYVPQHDNLVPTMTAYESVSFYASIVLPAHMSQDARKARIIRVLRMMGLSHAQNTLVGGTLPGGIMLRGMSGGERKRLAIACGVVAGPSLVFLDEPTSGLDSFAALNVVLFLKSMATEHGATLLASLHQPRQAIWSQMDQVTLLSSGRLMYTGPTGGLVPWFTSLGYAYDPEIHGMASDWALDLVSLGFTKPQQEQSADAEAAPAAVAAAGGWASGQQQQDKADGRDTASDGSGSMNTYYSASASGREAVAADSAASAAAAAGSSSMARRLQQQQAALQAGSSMMRSKKELSDAAAAFLAQLQICQPELFSAKAALSALARGQIGPVLVPPTARSGSGLQADNHTRTQSEENGIAYGNSLFSNPVTVHEGEVVRAPTTDDTTTDRIETQFVQLQRVKWWSDAGINGGAPAPPPGSQYVAAADAVAGAPPGSKWWADGAGISQGQRAQGTGYSIPDSPVSNTSSAVLLKEQTCSTDVMSPTASTAGRSSTAAAAAAAAGKPAMKQAKQLSFVDESGPFAEQSAVPAGAASGGSGVVAVRPPPIGLAGVREGMPQQSLWDQAYTGFSKYRALLWRELLITTRNPADVGGRMMTFTYVSFLSGLVSWSLPGGADSMFQRMSVAYAVLTFYFLMPFVFMSIFTSDKRFFAQDATARLYHPAQYYWSKITVALPFNVIVAIVFHLVYYGMTGMRHGAESLAMACCICVLTGLIGMQAVYFCGIVASSQDLAFVYAIAWTALNLLVNPYMASFDEYTLGWGFSWLRFVSPCSFAWQALINIEFSGRGFDCNNGAGTEAVGLYPNLLPQGGTFDVVRRNINRLGQLSRNGQCVASGDAIVKMYTMGLSFGETVGVLLGFYVLFLTATYIVVKRSANAKSKV